MPVSAMSTSVEHRFLGLLLQCKCKDDLATCKYFAGPRLSFRCTTHKEIEHTRDLEMIGRLITVQHVPTLDMISVLVMLELL